MRFHKPVRYAALTIAVVALISLVMHVSVRMEDSKTRRKKLIVYNLVSIGQKLEFAQERLRNAGFELLYDEPITPTVTESHLSQIVIVGNPVPSAFETFGYAAELSWMPFTRTESAYVKLRADLEGIITSID